MRCPRCNQEGLNPYNTCAHCQFRGAPRSIEELGHVTYLLGEIETWQEVEPTARDALRRRYLGRREELEIGLGVRLPPLSAQQVQKLQWELVCLEALGREVVRWQDRDWVHAGSAERLRKGAQKRAEVLSQRLQDAPASPSFDDVRDRLRLLDYLAEMLSLADRRGHFVDELSRAAAEADLQARRHALEIEAGLRPRPVPVVPPSAVAASASPPEPAKAPKPPREPITWDRIWQTLLSERTLNVLLFLGAFLMMASALTYVVYNWETLPPVVQLGFIILFTLSFYGAGWLLRVRMELRASGIAVTAIGSLLVPLDFYAVGIAGGVLPAEQWPWVWLAASAVCLPIYTATALRIQAEFFGYLVAAAAGSLLCAGLWVIGVPPEWLLTALVALALGLFALTHRLGRDRSLWSILVKPFRFSSLIGTSAILPLGIGWWVTAGAAGSFDASLAGAWLLGAVFYLYAALREQSPLLGRAGATTLPVALLLILRLAFDPLAVEWPWYALFLAGLAPLYLIVGHRFYRRAAGDLVLRAHSHTATGWGLGLMAIAAVWSFFDLWAAAVTHAVLVLAAALAIHLWRQARALPAASLLAFSSATFGMAAAHLEPAELCLGWALLAVLHVLASLRLRSAPEYAARLLAAGLALAALTVLPPLILSNEPLLTYALGQWIVLAAWLLWLDNTGTQPGLTALLNRFGFLRQSLLHWAVALPLPFFAAMFYTRFRSPDAWLGLLLALLALVCFGIGQLRRLSGTSVQFRPSSFALRHWSLPWYVVGYGSSLAAQVLAFFFYDQPLLAVTVLLASVLCFASAWAFRARWWFVPAGIFLPLGLLILLDSWAVPWPQQSVILASAAAIYLLGGLWLEYKRGEPCRFMAPLYAVAHLVAILALIWGMTPAVEGLFGSLPWPDSARLWAAAGQLILAVAYGLFAWFQTRERWAHVGAWFGVLAGGLVASAYSQGRGSSAFKVALFAAAYVLAERALASGSVQRRWSGFKQAWLLYRRPLLVAGWAVSAGAIALALLRNLLLLGGGRIQTAWAIAGLLTVTALYAISAWLFRRRLFVWLAGMLVIAPWTLLTAWGWFLWLAPPPLPRFALSWAVLACLELVLGLALTRFVVKQKVDHGFPLRVISNLLLPFALFWAIADPATSMLTCGLGLGFYALSAAADHRRGLTGWRAARFLYPAVALAPVWAVYLLNYFWPTAAYEWYGLILLALALPLLALGRLLRRVDPADGLPLYLGAYGVAIIGTLLVAHQPPLFAAALIFDALLCVLSAWIFHEPMWGYPAAGLASAALLVALIESQIPPDRRGWCLIGLGAIYLVLAWALHRGRLREYVTPPLVVAFAVIALGLPPSSLDDTGAFWGYLAAALLYAVGAAWLRQPLLLAASAGLLAVPYGVAMVWLDLAPANYGLVLFPGVAIVLALAHLLDWRLGRPAAILPSWDPKTWRLGALLDWWAAPWYAWAYAGALAAVGLSWGNSTRLAIALALAGMAFLHATWRFQSRVCLLVAGVLAQGAALAVIDAWGWLAQPAWAALAFLPVTALTAALALTVELWRREGSPLSTNWWLGWSRPLYLLLAIDLIVGQAAALTQSDPGAFVTIANALLLALLATVWVQTVLPFVAAGVGVLGACQGMAWADLKATVYPVGLALLALGYGFLGYGLTLALRGRRRVQIWSRPLEWAALSLSGVALLWAVVVDLDLWVLPIGALVGRAVDLTSYSDRLRTLMWVLALTGLLYLATAFVRRWHILGYGAVALLLVAWALWWRFFLDMPGVQWYAVLAGLYLLGVGWMEWRQGRKSLARWIDGAGMLVWLGTAWWQSLPGVMVNGWPYALLMGTESLLLVWWGSARRQKRFLYIGAVALVLNVVTQSIEPLLSVNRWIVFGIVGALLVGLAILVERNLKTIRELSAEMRVRLEGWE